VGERRYRCGLAVGVALLVIAASAARASLPTDVRQALDRMLACERPEGGWTYRCRPPRGPHGAVTWPLLRARRLAKIFGRDDWDVVVLRSPGTSAAGLLLLEAWRRGGDARDLAAARRAGDLLVSLQLSNGGWYSEMPVHGTRVAWWFRAIAHWATLDDDVTSGAVRMLLALAEVTGETGYRDAAMRGLDLLLAAQLPAGGWPLTWRPGWIVSLNATFEDLPSTNDAATAGPAAALLDGARVLGRPDLLAAAHRTGAWLAAAQGTPPLAGWAQQYAVDGRPAPGRSFEPAAWASWESRIMIDALLQIAAATGDDSLCEPVARGVRWLVRAAIQPGCWARFYEPGSGKPLFIGPDGRPVGTPTEGRRPYRWIGDYGIPGLLAGLGLDGGGRPLRVGAASHPPRRIPGDPGACPGFVPLEAQLPGGPRSRIITAAVLLDRMTPLPDVPCRDEVRAALSR
jgi:pectate lyase-like protein